MTHIIWLQKENAVGTQVAGSQKENAVGTQVAGSQLHRYIYIMNAEKFYFGVTLVSYMSAAFSMH